MSKESFLLYHGYYEPIKNLPNEDKGMLLDAIFQYSIHGTEPESTSKVFMAFQFFKNQINQDTRKYNKIVDRNHENGLKGGRPKNPDNPDNPVGLKKPRKADTVTVTVTDTDTVTDFERWANQIVNGEDQFWEQMKGRRILRQEMDSFLSVAVRNKWKIETQQEFRIALRGFKSSDIIKSDKPNYKLQ